MKDIISTACLFLLGFLWYNMLGDIRMMAHLGMDIEARAVCFFYYQVACSPVYVLYFCRYMRGCEPFFCKPMK